MTRSTAASAAYRASVPRHFFVNSEKLLPDVGDLAAREKWIALPFKHILRYRPCVFDSSAAANKY